MSPGPTVPENIDGAQILSELSTWLKRYVHFTDDGMADAIAAWVVSTWLVDITNIAPILALLSPTKRTAKTTLFDLLRGVVRKPRATSVVGLTPAALFRLNHKERPTFLIDEAEALSSSSRDLIGLLNNGHRRGSEVHRCVEKGGDYEVRAFDAYGFRAVGLIGKLWDTLQDRSIVIPMQRKSKEVRVDRFDWQAVKDGGEALASRIQAWVEHHVDEFNQALRAASRPSWLNDRDCDNWSCLFAVAAVAGSEWPDRIGKAARILCNQPGGDNDPGERLILDIHRIFSNRDFPEAITSGDLAAALNRIETSPWGEWRGGKGLSAHKLASLIAPFQVGPYQRRTKDQKKIRGYWLADRNLSTTMGHSTGLIREQCPVW